MCGPAGTNGGRGTLMDGTSRLTLPDGTVLQHGLMTACFAVASAATPKKPLKPGEFNPANDSFHPIEAQGTNQTGTMQASHWRTLSRRKWPNFPSTVR